MVCISTLRRYYIEDKLVMYIFNLKAYKVIMCVCIYTYIYYTQHITETCCHCGQRAVIHVFVIHFLSTTERWRFEVTTERSGNIHG